MLRLEPNPIDIVNIRYSSAHTTETHPNIPHTHRKDRNFPIAHKHTSLPESDRMYRVVAYTLGRKGFVSSWLEVQLLLFASGRQAAGDIWER